MSRFIAKKHFVYNGKKYKPGDIFNPDEHNMSARKLKLRIEANMLVDTSVLTDKQIKALSDSLKPKTVATPKTDIPVAESEPAIVGVSDNTDSSENNRHNRRKNN